MTVRGCMVQNLGKHCKVVSKDGYIFWKGRVTREMIDMSVGLRWMNEKIISEEYGRSHDADGARTVLVITIE